MSDPIGLEADAVYGWASHATRDRDVLDVGSGDGGGTALLLAAGARSALGVEPDPAAVETARSLHGDRIEFRIADPVDLGLDDGRFDAVTCFGPLERAPNPAPLVAELRRVLAPQGILIVSLRVGRGRREDAPKVAAKDAGTMVPRPEVTPPTREQWSSILGAELRNVRLLPQRLCLAVVIGAPGSDADAPAPIADAALLDGEPDDERTLLAIAGDGELPDPPSVARLSGLAELHALEGQLRDWEARARRAEAEGSAKHWELVAAREAQRRLRKRLHELEHRPLRVISRVLRGKPARLGPGPPLRHSEHPEDWD